MSTGTTTGGGIDRRTADGGAWRRGGASGVVERRTTVTPASRCGLAGVLALALLLTGAAVSAHETDQYSIRDVELADSTEALNDGFNRRLAEIADGWWRGENRAKFAKRVFYTLGGNHYIDKYERWARRNPEIETLWMPRSESIYRGGPFWATRVVFFFGLGPVIRLNDQLVGTDKIGHFLSQGWKYYKRHLRGVPDERVVGIGLRNESGIFGFMTTGVFSNADLVANYEGYLFYRSLFEDDIVPGKPALIEWLGSGARLQRPFDWRDHVNAYWDEALNPGIYDSLLRNRVADHLGDLCDLYREAPQAFVAADDQQLAERYAIVRLRDASHNRLDQLCSAQAPGSEAASRTTANH